MVSEIKLFIDDIKPAILISKKAYEKNIEILRNYRCKELISTGYLVYKNEEDIKDKLLGEILGYPTFCAKEFELNKGKPKPDIIVNKFLNYGGISFNCYEKQEEALAWCNKKYKDKMISKYGKVDVTYKEVEFKKNYLQGYEGTIKNMKRFEIVS